MRGAIVLIAAAMLAGCGDDAPKPAAAKPVPVLGAKTKDVGKYDINNKQWRRAN